MWPTITIKTDVSHTTQWNLIRTIFTTLDAVWNGSSLVWYLSTVKLKLLLAKAVQHRAIPGLYSGIFAIYLQYRGSQKSTDRAKNILFYALWVLYALTTATIIVDMLICFLIDAVSVDHHRRLTLFQFVQNVETRILYHLAIIQGTVFALCDVIAQSILVRTTGNTYHHSSNSSKDISLLDRLGLQHSCGDRSVILSIRIFRYIDLCSFTDWF